MTKLLSWTTLMVALVGLVGCDGGGPPAKPSGVAVSGKILLSTGAPLTGGLLMLRPVGGIHGATATIQNDGTFELADQSGAKTVVPGQYQVYVRFNDPSLKALQAAVPKRYQESEDADSDVIVDITQATTDLVIKLKR